MAIIERAPVMPAIKEGAGMTVEVGGEDDGGGEQCRPRDR